MVSIFGSRFAASVVSGRAVGRRADGGPWLVPAPGAGLPHGLISGVTGSGKSGLVQAILGAYADTDIAVAGIDLKGGVELGAWSPRLTVLATSPDEATALLLDVMALVQYRADRLASLGARSWVPDLGPRLLLIVDELAEIKAGDISALVGDADNGDALAKLMKQQNAFGTLRLQLLESIARLSRAVGVSLLCATQYPLAEIVPSGLRSQLGFRAMGRVTSSEQVNVALGAGMAASVDVDAIGVGEPGTCFVLGVPGFDKPTRCRGFYVDDKRLAARVTATTGYRVDGCELWAPGVRS